MTSTLPAARCGTTTGVSRDEKTLQPTLYLNKLPETIDPASHVLISDPMLATGASSKHRNMQRLALQPSDPAHNDKGWQTELCVGGPP